MNVRSWSEAQDDHQDALTQFTAAVDAVPALAWTCPTAPGKWSPAAVALHVARAYELGHEAIRGGSGMRLRVGRFQAWVLREFLLPYILASGRFPHGVDAPAEVVPDLAEASQTSAAEASERLSAAAAAALESLRAAGHERPPPTLRHAYFGDLGPLAALRLLSAHTRHHARGLAHAAESSAFPRRPGSS